MSGKHLSFLAVAVIVVIGAVLLFVPGQTGREALPEAGGMLRVGIPAHRLPREIIDQEIEVITIVASEVPTARCMTTDSSMPSLRNSQTSTGTITRPPPTPSRPAMTPATRPVSRYAASSSNVVTGSR